METEKLTGNFFNLWVNIRIGSDGSRDLADCDIPFQGAESIAVPQHFRQPAREFEAEGNGFAVDAVGTTDHDGVAVLLGLVANGLDAFL